MGMAVLAKHSTPVDGGTRFCFTAKNVCRLHVDKKCSEAKNRIPERNRSGYLPSMVPN